jgi:hypothetical protein
MSFITFTQGQNISRIEDILFIRNGATKKVEHSQPYNFYISPLSEESFTVTSAPDGYMLMGNFHLIVPQGSKMIIAQDAKKAKNKPINASSISRILPGSTSGSVYTTYQGGRTLDGVNIYGHVCRMGSITVTEKGLVLSAGTEMLAGAR